jgi:DNA-binding Lrp family transcriptional regulator
LPYVISLRLNCELGEDQIISELNKLAGVTATELDGPYDIIAKVNAESTEKLKEIITLNMIKTDRIKSMLTLIVIEEECQGK